MADRVPGVNRGLRTVILSEAKEAMAEDGLLRFAQDDS
jgi:hypothetical protein